MLSALCVCTFGIEIMYERVDICIWHIIITDQQLPVRSKKKRETKNKFQVTSRTRANESHIDRCLHYARFSDSVCICIKKAKWIDWNEKMFMFTYTLKHDTQDAFQLDFPLKWFRMPPFITIMGSFQSNVFHSFLTPFTFDLLLINHIFWLFTWNKKWCVLVIFGRSRKLCGNHFSTISNI